MSTTLLLAAGLFPVPREQANWEMRNKIQRLTPIPPSVAIYFLSW
jgi:hypothetical protein